MKKSLKLSAIFLVFGSLLIGCDRKHHFDWEGKEGKTLAGVNALHHCLVAHLLDQSNTTDVNALLSLVIKECKEDFKESQDLQFRDDGTINDIWGRPINIEIIDPGFETKKPHIKVCSFGENGLDEQGKGDDIVAEK